MEVFKFGDLVGRVQMANANEKLNKLMRIKLLKQIQDEGLHKCMPGTKNLHEFFKKIGISKTTGYEEFKALEMLGDQTVELLIELGVTSKDSYLLAKSMETKDAEFEVLDRESGEFRVGGQVVTMDGDRGLISDAMLRAIQRVKLEQGARRETERKLEEKTGEAKTLTEKVRKGEDHYARLEADAQRRRRGLLEESDGAFGELVMNLMALIKTMSETELTEAEQGRAERYLNLIEGNALQTIYEKLRVYLPKPEWEE